MAPGGLSPVSVRGPTITGSAQAPGKRAEPSGWPCHPVAPDRAAPSRHGGPPGGVVVSTGRVPAFKGPGSWGPLIFTLLILAAAFTGALVAYANQAP